MSWLQTFLIVLVALMWATTGAFLVLTNAPLGPAIIAIMTTPFMFVLGAAFGIPLKRIAKALREEANGE